MQEKKVQILYNFPQIIIIKKKKKGKSFLSAVLEATKPS